MILVDYSNVAIASLYGAFYNGVEQLGISFLMGKLRNYNVDHREEYGELVICADGPGSWRKDIFPNYKCRRHSKESTDDEIKLYEYMGEFYETLVKHSPYRCIKIPKYEGDDIMAILSEKPGKHIIISADKDMTQLCSDRIKVFNPIKKEFIDNGPNFLTSLIVRGDAGDDVPNMLSDDDIFITEGTRQKSITKKIIEPMMESTDPFYMIDELPDVKGITKDKIKENYIRNKKIVSLMDFDEEFMEPVFTEFENQENKKFDIMSWMIAAKCSHYIDKLGDFKKGK